eukprot:9044013-Karenia_brevis.AAC.1
MPSPIPLGFVFLPVAGAEVPLAVFLAAAACAGVDATGCISTLPVADSNGPPGTSCGVAPLALAEL